MKQYSFNLLITLALATAAAPTDSNAAAGCVVSSYSAVASAVATCIEITLSNIAVPGGSTLDLTKLKSGATVTFAGKTTFSYKNADYDMIQIGGSDITITAQKGAIIDGNGDAWWDGQGSNGGRTKPNHFIVVDKVSGKSIIQNLHIQNWPTHCFSIQGCDGLIVQNNILDNSAGNEPNSASGGKPAAHNTDGFDLGSSNNIVLSNNNVINQDDCVAITSGTNITVTGMTCDGGHGLSIGSIGGKSNNHVQDVRFEHSSVFNSQNGARIKTNSGTTGTVQGITYDNITLSNISDYGIDIQQDYLNGGPTGKPTNGVKINGVIMTNITGTVKGGRDYYILCGDGSCSSFIFDDISIVGGSKHSCNYKPQGDFSC